MATLKKKRKDARGTENLEFKQKLSKRGPDGEPVGLVGIYWHGRHIGDIEHKKGQPCIIRFRAKANWKSREKNPDCDWRWVRLSIEPATVPIAKELIRMQVKSILKIVHPRLSGQYAGKGAV